MCVFLVSLAPFFFFFFFHFSHDLERCLSIGCIQICIQFIKISARGQFVEHKKSVIVTSLR